MVHYSFVIIHPSLFIIHYSFVIESAVCSASMLLASFTSAVHVCVSIGLARTIYLQCTYVYQMGWPEPYICIARMCINRVGQNHISALHVCVSIGLARTIYLQCTYVYQ